MLLCYWTKFSGQWRRSGVGMGKKLSPQKNPPTTLLLTVTQAAWHWQHLLSNLHNDLLVGSRAEWHHSQQVWKPKDQKCTGVRVLETPKGISALGDGGDVLQSPSTAAHLVAKTPRVVLAYLCARALNSRKAEPHPDSGQAEWGDRAPQASIRAVVSNCLKIRHHLLHATIFFQLSTYSC